MKKIAYIDFYNLMWRIAHSAGKQTHIDDRIGLMIHNMLTSMVYAQRVLGTENIMVGIDSGSWRKTVYPRYKLNRITTRLKKSPKEQEDDNKILAAAKEFGEYLKMRTCVPTIKVDGAEADDVFGTMITDNPDIEHIIMSTDSDFYQLVGDKVNLFDPTKKQYVTLNGFFDENMKPVIDQKTGKHKVLGDPEYVLFKKCIRGDSSDNIMSAFPKVREKVASKNKTVGIINCFEDRHDKSFEWNNFMKSEWTDMLGNKHIVNEDYELNRSIIDLRAIPEDIKNSIRLEVLDQMEMAEAMKPRDVGFGFIKFCQKWELNSLSTQLSTMTALLVNKV